MAPQPFKLPIINLKNVDRQAEAKKIIHALENVGFLYVDGVDLDFKKMHQSCEWFFSQPEEVKGALTRNFWKAKNKNVYRGYFPVVPGEPSRKEAFEFGLDVPQGDSTVKPNNWMYEKSVWPEEDGKFPFKRAMEEWYSIFHEAGLDVLRLTSLGLGIPENSFDEIFTDKPLSTLRILHYPPWEGEPPASAITHDGKFVTTPDHTDSNFLTILATFHYGGLEVFTADGKWAQVESRTNSLVMNIGDVFSRMMGGRFKATRHRVIDIRSDRFSMPFFMEPGYNGDIGLNWMSKVTGTGPKHEMERYGPWLLQQIKYKKKYFEYRVLPDIE